ncbi:hypothetical protein MIND_00978900 [Mycena indigotica]|uniref:Uncharacterized protein n=1 Tax=Mycena indigotica TaxID=2126181 RepID=A0A8H6VXH0_9AGAR|nr:uncharacterized protein MIND_00978900 [Mycena indigotica]KAF7297452.1 hypothetical protein MIND_00978900 [Mycena indigotica]
MGGGSLRCNIADPVTKPDPDSKSDPWTTAAALFAQSPHLAQYVHHLIIELQPVFNYRHEIPKASLAFLTLLVNVRIFEITPQSYMSWYHAPKAVPAPIFAFLRSRKDRPLDKVSVTKVGHLPIEWVIQALESTKNLYLYFCCLKEYDMDRGRLRTPMTKFLKYNHSAGASLPRTLSLHFSSNVVQLLSHTSFKKYLPSVHTLTMSEYGLESDLVPTIAFFGLLAPTVKHLVIDTMREINTFSMPCSWPALNTLEVHQTKDDLENEGEHPWILTHVLNEILSPTHASPELTELTIVLSHTIDDMPEGSIDPTRSKPVAWALNSTLMALFDRICASHSTLRTIRWVTVFSFTSTGYDDDDVYTPYPVEAALAQHLAFWEALTRALPKVAASGCLVFEDRKPTL